MAGQKTLLVVDQDEATRLSAVGVASRLGYELRGAENGEVALELLDDVTPELAIIEVELPGALSGLELLRELHGRFGADLPVILVSAERTTAQDRVTGFLLGADDYLAKPIDSGELLARVRRSLRRAGTPAANGERAPRRIVSLSPRELEILQLLADGQTQAQIASTLFLSPKTVSTHIQHLLAKLGVHSRAQAVAAAYKLGLVHADVQAHVTPRSLAPLA